MIPNCLKPGAFPALLAWPRLLYLTVIFSFFERQSHLNLLSHFVIGLSGLRPLALVARPIHYALAKNNASPSTIYSNFIINA